MEDQLTYNDIADYFLAFGNCTNTLITNLKLQKLVYYTQAWHIAVYKTHLFDQDFQAWIHGPVLVELYNQYKHYKWYPIIRDDLDENALNSIFNKFPNSLKELIDDIIEEYFTMEAYALEYETHHEDPWLIARNGIPNDESSTAIITKKSMQTYYEKYVNYGSKI